MKCFAGCSNEDIMGALGFEMKDLFVEESHTTNYSGNNSKHKREITAVYDYKDLDGNIIHSTIRYSPKGFSQRRPDQDSPGNYIWKEVFKGITPILYNLHAVNTAIKEKQPVLVVEGEKDCDNLAKLGFVATTCPMGAGKWHKHYSTMLKGGTVYIIADNDEIGNNHSINVAKSLIGESISVYLVGMPELSESGDISDFIAKTPTEEIKTVIEGLLAAAVPFTMEEEQEETAVGNGSTGKITPAEQLLNMIDAMGVKFFHDEIKELYAAIPVNNHMEVLSISSRDFELWLNGQFYKETRKPISKDGIKQVLAVTSAKALYDNPQPKRLSTRTAEHDGAFWYDLTNADWQAVKISQDGWEIVDNPPILFARYRHQIQQTTPTTSGNIRKILDYVNISGNDTLFLCWLVSCFVPHIPHAMPVLYGEKGAAKSTTSSLLKNLIDPSALDTLTLPNDQRTLAVNLQSHWFLPFDNVSYINEDISDTLCRAITGGGIQQRKLHTNTEDTIFTFQRCLAINGINNVATRSDLLDRAILIELVRIPDASRRELAEIQTNFEADKPSILGGIFDTLAKAITIQPTVKLQNLPRMADFAKWGYAIAEALEQGLGQVFLDEYESNRL
jgi:5S rRNA maturation endonuclease (ribonuclease M5)